MKTILALAVLFNLSPVSAQVAVPKFYAAKWKIAKVSPMCPATIPDGAVCAGFGSIVTVTTKIGCADRIVFKDLDVTSDNVIRAFGVVELNLFAECAGTRTIRETVIAPNPGRVSLEHVTLE